jgi:hypothetical protein
MTAAPTESDLARPGARAAYVQACLKAAEAELARLEAEVASSSEQVAQLSARLRAASRELHLARARRQVVRALLASERERLAVDFDQLVALPGVRSVEVNRGRFRVLTETIYLKHAGATNRIGDFALELDLERGSRIQNLANSGAKAGWDHPHVQAQMPCLGNLRDGFEKLLGELQLAPLISMLLQFLETYDPATAYCSIDQWERVEP